MRHKVLLGPGPEPDPHPTERRTDASRPRRGKPYASPVADPRSDRRWPRRVYGVGTEPDPRFTFANERTFLAWIRTSLGFLAAGVGVAAVGRLGGSLGPESQVTALVLILCGLVSGLSAFGRWIGNERAMRLDEPMPSSRLLPVLTGAVVLAAVAALVTVSLG